MKPLGAGAAVPYLKEVVVPAVRLSPGVLTCSVAYAAAGVLVPSDAVVCWSGQGGVVQAEIPPEVLPVELGL